MPCISYRRMKPPASKTQLFYLKNANLILYIVSNALLIWFLFYMNSGWLYVVAFSVPAHVRDSLCALFNMLYKLWRFSQCRIFTAPKLNHTICFVIPCYTEPIKDILLTLKTLKHQRGLDECKRLYLIILDGQKVGLHNDTHLYAEFKQKLGVSFEIDITYKTWKKTQIQITLGCSAYQDIPVILCGKHINNGKKCSLIFSDELLIDLFENEEFLNDPALIARLALFLQGWDIETLDAIYHTDADTKIESECIKLLMQELLIRNSDAVCGFVKVDFTNANRWFNFWNNLQYCQYFGDQMLKRSVEGVFGMVTCLPGCNTLVRPSDRLTQTLIDYKRLPQETSLIQTVSRMIGTDRCYTKALLKNGGKVTMQENAFIFTECPQDLKTLLSQRKRWNSNALSNAMCVLRSTRTSWFNKVNSFIDITRLYFTPFRFASMIGFFMGLASFSLEQLLMLLFLCATSQLYVIVQYFLWERDYTWNLVLGWFLNKPFTPFFSLAVTTKLMATLLDFKWGATQQTKSAECLIPAPGEPKLVIVVQDAPESSAASDAGTFSTLSVAEPREIKNHGGGDSKGEPEGSSVSGSSLEIAIHPECDFR